MNELFYILEIFLYVAGFLILCGLCTMWLDPPYRSSREKYLELKASGYKWPSVRCKYCSGKIGDGDDGCPCGATQK